MRWVHGWVPVLVLVVGCSKDEPPIGPGPQPVAPHSETGTPAPTGDPSTPPTDPGPLGTECTEDIVVPQSSIGTIGDPVVADPHTAVYGAAPDPLMVRYSWPGNDPSTSASFLWRTDNDTKASLLELGAAGTGRVRVLGASFLFDGTPEEYRIHEVKLCDRLEPGTTYQYRVGGDDHWSPMYTFRTPEAPGTFDTFRVGFVGDSRGSYEEWAQIFAAMDSYDPDFFVFTGDAVGYGANQDEWDAWFRATGDVLASKAFVPAHGNHEGLATNYFAQMSLPGNEQWFTIKYGNLHLVVLNDTATGVTTLSDEARYIDRSFAEAVPGYVGVAAHHQGLYATCTNHGSNETLRDLWAPHYDTWGVRLVVNGHNHLYERSVPIRGGVEVPMTDGAVYVTTGGAGAPLYRTVDPDEWFGNVANPIEHFVIADFGPTGIHVVARDLAGNVIDEFTR